MNATNVTLTAVAPHYATDGSRGYFLYVTRGRRALGWIRVGDDNRTVYATLERAPWEPVGTVAAPAELTPTWIAEHADAILRPF
jgi:hypothetical protein